MFVPYDPYFLETEFKAMVSEMVLSNVVETLDLNTAWGKRYGRTLDTAETIKLLGPQIDIENPPNTRLVEIRVTDEDPNEAARIANAIAEAYKDYRIAQHDRQMAAGIKALEEGYVKEEAKISLMQSNLDLLRRQLNIDGNNPPSNQAPLPTINLEQQQHVKELLSEDEAGYLKLKNELVRLQSLQATNPAVLRDVLPTMTSDDMLADLLRKLDENTRKLAAETNGVGGISPDRAALQTSIAHLNNQIDNRVAGIMITLQTRVDSAKTALDTIYRRLEELDAARGPYWEAKDKLEQEKETAELLKVNIEFDKKDDSIPKRIPVEVIDPAVPPKSPSGPSRELGVSFLICGLMISGFGFYSLRNAGKVPRTSP